MPLAFALAFAFVATSAAAQSAVETGSTPAAVVPVLLPHPVYSPIAQSARVQGVVEITVSVRPDGTVASAVVTGRDRPLLALLSETALAAAEKATFDCRACAGGPVQYTILYEFKMNGHVPGKQPDPVRVSAERSLVTTLAQAPICDHCGGHSRTIQVRSVKCLWLWKCGLEER